MALSHQHHPQAEGGFDRLAASGVLAGLDASLLPGGEKTPDEDAPKPKDGDDKKSEAEKQDELDEELDDSFPASDPPSQTQP